MKNKEQFLTVVEKCAYVRQNINDVHHKYMSGLREIYANAFDRDAREFTYAKDILYYKGGWPSENTPARALTLAKHIHQAHLILSFIGEERELMMYLKKFGLELKVINEDAYYGNFAANADWMKHSDRRDIVMKLWGELDIEENLSGNPKELLKTLMMKAMERQKIICDQADLIKINAAELIEQHCGVKKKDFLKAVQLKAKTLKEKAIDKDLIKNKDDAFGTIEVLRTIAQKEYGSK